MPEQSTSLLRSPWILIVGVVVLLVASLIPGRRAVVGGEDEIGILCTFLPTYVFTLNVVGDAPEVSVDLLVSQDLGCPHHYSVSAGDLRRIARADVIVAVGLGAEPFLDRVVRDRRERILTIADECDVLAGHAACDGHPHGEDGHAGHDHEHHLVNPHVWASPRQAAIQVRTLARKLAEVDPARAEHYRANGEAYAARLMALDGGMRDAAARFRDRNIVTFHDAFDYLARDLDLHVVATLEPVPGQPPGPREMQRLIETIRAQDVVAVFYEPAYADRLPKTIARDAGIPAYPLNPFNSFEGKVTASAYEEVMACNLETLREALGQLP